MKSIRVCVAAPLIGLVAFCAARDGSAQSCRASRASTSEVAESADAFMEFASFAPADVQAQSDPMRESCEHHLPNGAYIDDKGDVRIRDRIVDHYPPCRHPVIPPADNGYVADMYAYAHANTHGLNLATGKNWFNAIQTRYNVPSAPPNPQDGQLLYLWAGLADVNGQRSILQPVLQWGFNGQFGTNYSWGIANWYYVAANGASQAHGDFTSVKTGDYIDTQIWVDPGSPCNLDGTGCYWNMSYSVSGGPPVYTYFDLVAPSDVYVLSYTAVLEVTNVKGCRDLPGGGNDSFVNFGIYEPGPNYNNYNSISTPWVAPEHQSGGACQYNAARDPFLGIDWVAWATQ